MNSSNRIKAEQLGMPHGTACGRLRKAIMFSLIQELGLDACYQCGHPIESVGDLSIEHKEHWLHSDDPVGKFFDLENIAFSHLICNSLARRRNGSRRQQKYGHGVSHYKGMYCDPRRPKPWRARIFVDGKKVHVGYYATEREAALAYNEANLKANGDRAIPNDID